MEDNRRAIAAVVLEVDLAAVRSVRRVRHRLEITPATSR
jgi:hypothetical protein